MGMRNDRVILFRDDRYEVINKKVYLILKEDNSMLAINGTNKIYLFIKTFKNDKEALDNLFLYEAVTKSIAQVSGIEDVIQILFEKDIRTLSKLADILAVNNFITLSDFKLTNNYIFTKNNSCKIIKNNSGYTIIKNKYKDVLKPIFIINETYSNGKCNVNKTLFVKNLPNGLKLITDTNPDRNIAPETV